MCVAVPPPPAPACSACFFRKELSPQDRQFLCSQHLGWAPRNAWEARLSYKGPPGAGTWLRRNPAVPQRPPPHLASPCPQVCLHRCPARTQGLQEVDPGDGRGARAVHQPAVPSPGHHARAAASPRGVSGPHRRRRPQSGLSLEYVAPGGCRSGSSPRTALWGPAS